MLPLRLCYLNYRRIQGGRGGLELASGNSTPDHMFMVWPVGGPTRRTSRAAKVREPKKLQTTSSTTFSLDPHDHPRVVHGAGGKPSTLKPQP